MVVATVPAAPLSFPVVAIDAPVAAIDGSMSIYRSRVVLRSDVLFAVDSARLSASARARIRNVAHELDRRHANGLRVVGFTDSRGSSSYNLRLSLRRAEAVRDALGRNVTASGLGETHPVASNATAHGRALNRRVEIRFG